MDNQDLDKLFRETLGDFRDTPEPGVWTRIRTTLDGEKKSRRLVPLWYRLGIAAALLLGAFFLFAPWDNPDPAASPAPVVSPVVTTPGNRQVDPAKRLDALPSPLESQQVAEQELGVREREPAGNRNQGAKPEASSGQVVDKETAPPPVTLVASREPSPPTASGKGQAGALQEPAAGQPLADLDQDREDPGNGLTPPRPGVQGPENPSPAALEDRQGGQPSIFEALESREDPVAEGPKGPRWSVGPSLAPVYFSSFGDGSPISSSFVANDKSGSFNMSYGLQVAYGVSKKLSLRTGIHRVDYGYNTEEIGFTASPVGSGSSLIRTINYSENSRDLVVKSMVNGSRQPGNKEATDVTAPSPVREGRMVQEFGYLEIPLEMQYTLIDKTWGVNLIGGMSSLFLVNNSVSLESAGAVTEVGEATNMNSLNFSTNFGVGVYYRLNQNMELNVLPMFKYQLNTFSATSGNFRPYSVGVYSGLNFRF